MNNAKTTIYIVPHGQSESNALSERNVSHTDERWGELQSPLTELGRKQAKEIAEKLRHTHFDAIFSSDLNRARQTAETIAHGRSLAVATNSTIREREYGKEFFKLTQEKRHELKKALSELHEEGKFAHKFFPNAESAADAVNRFLKFLDEIVPLYKGKTILVVNHGAVMRMFLVHLAWAKFDELPSGSILNTGYYVLEADGKQFHIKETHGVNKKI